jgi:uncharacterized phage protein gp47/JayE
MADILKVYTAEQLYTLYRNKILADNVGLTDFNSGSKTRALLESNSEIVSSISMDFKEAIYKAIPIALYEGFGFSKTGATKAIGFLRPYRKPAFWITYTGSGTSAKITSTSTDFDSAVIGAPGDAFSFAYSTYTTLTSLVAAIDALPNWTATLVGTGSTASNTLYQYSGKEAIGSTNYLNTTGLDIMLATATAIAVPTGYSVSVNQQTILTTADGTIAAGESGATIAAENSLAGINGNILANAIDTLNGSGYINSVIDGIEYAINDSSFSGGADGETNDERKTRFSEAVNGLNAGTELGIISALKTITGVRSVGIRESYPFVGTNTIIVDDGTQTISATLLAEIEKVLYGDASDFENYPGKNAAGMGYLIDAPTIVAVNVNITAYRLPSVNVDLTEIKSDIETAVEQYINTRGLGEDVLLSEIVKVGKNSNAAVYDLIVNSPATNTSISDNEFAKTGSGTGATVVATVSIAPST